MTAAWADFEKSGNLLTGLIVHQLDVKISESDLDLKSKKMIENDWNQRRRLL